MRQHPAAKRPRRRHAARRRRRGTLAILSLFAAALVLAGGAVAYWTTTGSGDAAASAADTQAITLTAGTPTAQLYPGGSADVAVEVSNPNIAPVHVGSLSLDTGAGTGGFEVDAGHTGCDMAVLSFTTQANAGNGWTIPPKVGATDGVLPVDLPAALAMSAGAANACQGASFLVHLNVGL
jgi:ferric-dicitrate binding protein FerR (iron transport regulator)